MGKLLTEKKRLEKQLKPVQTKIKLESDGMQNPTLSNPEIFALSVRAEKISERLKYLQNNAKTILTKVEEYKKTHSNNVIYTYI